MKVPLMLKYRDMTKQDLVVVTQIEQQANQFPWLLKHFESSLKSGHKAWVFYADDNEVLAYAIVQQILDEAHILNVCVKSSAQGQGYGNVVLDHVIDFSKSISANVILLEVRSSNHRAQGLYSKYGFNEMAVRKGYYPAEQGREDAILMGMDLGLMSLFSAE
jgi:ribosomal-protein-alanine N-acetyltransferase